MKCAAVGGRRRPGRTIARVGLGMVLMLIGLQPAFSYPANTWSHVQNIRFTVSCSEETKHLAGRALAIAEETAGTLASFFGYDFDGRRISIVLADEADEANGWAAGRDPLVFIDCRHTPSLFRGDTDWLRAVLTHELSHIYSLKLFNPPVVIDAVFGVSSSAERFEAVVSTAAGLNPVPLWFVEGVAQLGSYRLRADFRDPMREMVLRDALLGGRLLSAREMARFEGTSRDNELVYNQGFSFLVYLQERFGEECIRALCRAARTRGLERALRDTCQLSFAELLEDWQADLRQRYAGRETWNAGRRLLPHEKPPFNGPMVMELAAAGSGEYVLANWGHDYSRFSLFRRGAGGRYRELAGDCGRVLKEDRATGAVWFNRYVYNHSTGVDSYDIFRVGRGGRVERITTGSRSIAFDVLEDRLVYARYRAGRTEIVRREPAGREAVLADMPAGHDVFAVSLVSPERVLLSVAAGGRTRLALLEDGRLRWLWPDQDVLEGVYAGGSRAIFTSTRDGSPQIYWADFQEDPDLWYQLTAAPGGARFPALDGAAGSPRLVSSVYEDGGYYLYTLEEPFDRSRPVVLSLSPSVEPAAAEPEKKAVFLKTGSNTVWSRPALMLGVFSSRYDDASGVVMDWIGMTGLSLSIFNAPDNLGLDTFLQLWFPLFADVTMPPALSLGLLGSFDLGAFRNRVEYGLDTEVIHLGPGYNETIYHHQLYAESDYQLTSRQALAVFYRLGWHVDKLPDYRDDLYLVTHAAGLQWRYAHSRRSAFDPAGLGQPLLSLYAGGDLRYHTFPNLLYDPADWDVDPHPMARLQAGATCRALSPNSRLSLTLRAEGFANLESVRDEKPTPGMISGIGGGGAFSGYPAGYAWVNELIQGALEMAVNPFVDKAGPTRWYERLRLEAKLGGGLANFRADLPDIDLSGTGLPGNGLPRAELLSAEAGLRWSFYLRSNRESNLFLRAALPLNDPLGTLEGRPLQVYLGYGE